MLAPEQKKKTQQLICVQCWVLILIIKFFVICLFYKIVLHLFSDWCSQDFFWRIFKYTR